MKHIAMLLLLVTMVSFSLQAQKFKGGLIGGLSTSQIWGDGYSGFNKAGLLAGGFVNSNISDNVLWQFEMSYVEKGSRKPPRSVQGQTVYYLIELRYIEVPVLLRFNHLKLTHELGASLGVLFHSKEFDISGEVIPGTMNFNRTELAFILGTGYNLTARIFMSFRYSHSITPIADSIEFVGGSLGFFAGGSYSSVISFSLRYQFIKRASDAEQT